MNQFTFGKWLTILCSYIVSVWTKTPYLVQILLLLMGLDILSGLIAAIGSKSLRSTIMYIGLIKKAAIFPLLALLHIIEAPLNLPFHFESIAATAFIVYEAMSIVENAAFAGVPIPSVIVDALVKAKVRTTSPDDIRREFSETTRFSSQKRSSEIVQTEGSAPDLKVEKVVTTLEETHIEPVGAAEKKS